MRISKLLTVVVIAAAAAGMSACSSSSSSSSGSTAAPTETPIGGDIIAPVSVQANELQGETVELIVGQILNINTGDLATDSYTGEVADSAVATFVQGKTDGGAVLNPGVEALAVGETEVTMTNAQGGIQPLTFTVVVSAK